MSKVWYFINFMIYFLKTTHTDVKAGVSHLHVGNPLQCYTSGAL